MQLLSEKVSAVEDILNCELEHKSAELRKPAIVLIKKGSGIQSLQSVGEHVPGSERHILQDKQGKEITSNDASLEVPETGSVGKHVTVLNEHGADINRFGEFVNHSDQDNAQADVIVLCSPNTHPAVKTGSLNASDDKSAVKSKHFNVTCEFEADISMTLKTMEITKDVTDVLNNSQC